MHNIRGKSVDILGAALRKTRAHSSTVWQLVERHRSRVRVKVVFIHVLSESFTRIISPAKIASLPLSEHYFYPVSTPPTITTTKEKLKKGN